MRQFFGRVPVALVAIVTALGLVGSSVLSVQGFAAAQETAHTQLVAEQTSATIRLDEARRQQEALQLAIKNAETLVTESMGKTLDETAREGLTAIISSARSSLDAVTAQIVAVQEELRRVQEVLDQDLIFPWDVSSAATQLAEVPIPAATEIAQVVSDVGAKMTAVSDARAAWQAEQDRIAEAAAAAARAAAARAAKAAAERAAAANQIVTPPVAAPVAATPTVSFSAESYIYALAPNSVVTWVNNLCAVGTICGVALVGGYKTTPVQIQLDARLKNYYGSDSGIYVLTHEAAHARQWWTYVGNIISVSESQSGLVGKPAVEYMADCATIGKLQRNVGTYTSSCTPAQLSAIAGIW